jgi:hypothetical protein
MVHLSSPTVSNAPAEKLAEMRISFEERYEEMCEILKENNYLASQQ